jgi:hypothetical protein
LTLIPGGHDVNNWIYVGLLSMHQTDLRDLEEIDDCSECTRTAVGQLVMCFLYGDPLGVLYLLPSRYRLRNCGFHNNNSLSDSFTYLLH